MGEDEYINKLLWRGGSRRQRGAYGGQVIAQALMAACHTVTDPNMLLLSAHCYFMSPVKIDSPVTYRVARTKDGKVFSMRAVQVIQGDRIMSHCLASFKTPEPVTAVLSHSPAVFPHDMYPPDDPRHDLHSKEKLRFNHTIQLAKIPFDAYYCFSDSVQKKLLAKEPLEPRYGVTLEWGPPIMYTLTSFLFRMMSWLKIYGSLPQDSPQNVHRVALAFLSDFNMTFPLRLKYPTYSEGFSTSLDHTIWFHSPVQCDLTWFLQSVQCTQASEGTSLNSSHIYSEDGTLVATCQQQALHRLKSKL